MDSRIEMEVSIGERACQAASFPELFLGERVWEYLSLPGSLVPIAFSRRESLGRESLPGSLIPRAFSRRESLGIA